MTEMKAHFDEVEARDMSLAMYNDKHVFEVKQFKIRLGQLLQSEVIPQYEEDLQDVVEGVYRFDYEILRETIKKKVYFSIKLFNKLIVFIHKTSYSRKMQILILDKAVSQIDNLSYLARN